MDYEFWHRERKIRHRALGLMWCQIHNETSGNHLEPIDLNRAHIQTAPLSLDGNAQILPQFFAKYDKEIPYCLEWWEDESMRFLNQPPIPDRPDRNSDALSRFLKNHFRDCFFYNKQHYPATMTTSPAWGATGTLHEFRGGYEWWVDSVAHMSDDHSLEKADLQYPHLKALMRTPVIADDRLLRSEILTLVTLTASRLRKKKLCPHIIPPVFLISIVGQRHARVLESHYDGKTLIVRKTQFLDFTKENVELTQLLAQYWCGPPKGQTELVEPDAIQSTGAS
ncbi:uncharacterized protein N7459_005527 [Penicillium hispanicum]|uniref:uncharacterized protein n=1 Tax=Penicillium hispanicum TaxID=1080232 RepID=UPI0025411A79|nr:uncharacterized protein N7459_005527 [Penicillium hispanicum]KAJ5579542.1 hypothetical protein N7459_005527 [Penicillium hispanicum]